MSLIWWLFIISIFFYPTFIFLVFFTEKYPNTKFSKWWREHIIDRNEEYD